MLYRTQTLTKKLTLFTSWGWVLVILFKSNFAKSKCVALRTDMTVNWLRCCCAGAALRPERCLQGARVPGVRCHGCGQPAQESVPLPGLQAHHRHRASVPAVCVQATLPGTHGHGHRASHAVRQVTRPFNCWAPPRAGITVHCRACCVASFDCSERDEHQVVN